MQWTNVLLFEFTKFNYSMYTPSIGWLLLKAMIVFRSIILLYIFFNIFLCLSLYVHYWIISLGLIWSLDMIWLSFCFTQKNRLNKLLNVNRMLILTEDSIEFVLWTKLRALNSACFLISNGTRPISSYGFSTECNL